MKYFYLLTFIVLMTSSLVGQKVTISGYIYDNETQEQLIGANIFDELSQKGSISNNYGYYSMSLDAQSVQLNYSYIGYTDQQLSILLTKDTIVDIYLEPQVQLEVVEIIADKSRQIAHESQMSTIDIPIKQIKQVPALLGETDVLKALQLLPGVQSGGEGQNGLYIRGGSPDQNLILLDGVPVYNASHLFGFFSVFNADAIKDVKLVKGGFPARYGGRLSSVLEINMKEGNANKFTGQGSIGLVASKLTLEGPISDKTSFLVSGRRTYIDVLAKPFINSSFDDEGLEGGTGYFFHDINAKINHRLSDNDRLYLSFYTGLDKFFYEEKEKDVDISDFTNSALSWGNQTAALRWNHLWNQKLFSNTTFTFSNYGLTVASEFGTDFKAEDELESISLDYQSGIRDFGLKIDFDYLPDPDHFIRFGVGIIHHHFKPGDFDLKEIDTAEDYIFDLNVGQEDINALETQLYAEDDWKISENLKINMGIHLSGFYVDKTFYPSFQPRLSGRYLLNDESSIKASVSTMRQYIHLLSFDGIGLPTDLWLPSTSVVKPQDSYQFALAYARELSKSYELSVEAYYKKMANLIAYQEGSGLFEFSDWQSRITQGEGRSYGAEVFFQKRQGRLTGWVGYTLSWTNRTFEELNFGNTFPYRYDRRHDISVVAQYKLSDRINIAGTWVYGTGNAVTLSSGQYTAAINNGNYENYEQVNFYKSRNNFRMGAYHRLDIGINFVKKKKNHTRTWSFGAYNTYARKNPFFIFDDVDYVNGERVYALKQASLFPLIPYFTYAFQF